MKRRRLDTLLFGLAALACSAPARAAVFVVDSTGVEADDDLGDNLCHTAANTCTLPAAIAQADATPGTDTIQFSIAGASVHTISPPAGLPPLLESAVIDGTTQPGYAGTPLIELDGTTFRAPAYVPPACTGVFDDVACPGAFAVGFIEELAAEQITGGCSVVPPLYCPLSNNTRGQMAVFIVKTFTLQ